MKKFLFLLLGSTFLDSSIAQAHFDVKDEQLSSGKAVISLTDGLVQAKSPETEKQTDPFGDVVSKEENAKTEPKAEEDKGIFSFMDFSFLKKDKPQLSPKPNERKESFIERITRQAEEGDVDAQISLGYMYLYGKGGVDIDYNKAFSYYNMASKQGDPVAINNLGSLYFSGIGTEKNLVKSSELFEQAANLGNTEAAVNLAFIYLTKDSSLNNPYEAVQVLKSAADSNITAKFLLGYAYYKGFVVEKNDSKAFQLIKEATTKEYDEAEYFLGYMYLKGYGVTKNYGNAVKYFTRAANQGNVDAMITLGNILAQGKIYVKDLYRAHILFNIASVQGVNEASEKRDLLESKLKIEELLQAQAEAEKFKAQPSELTHYIRKTFGETIRQYIEENMSYQAGRKQS